MLNLSHDEDRQELQKLNTGLGQWMRLPCMLLILIYRFLEVYIERVRRLESQVETLNAELEVRHCSLACLFHSLSSISDHPEHQILLFR